MCSSILCSTIGGRVVSTKRRSCSSAFFGARGKGGMLASIGRLGFGSKHGVNIGCVPSTSDPILATTSFGSTLLDDNFRAMRCVKTFKASSG